MYEWTEEYSCKNEIVDKDHKKLFDLLNELLDAMKNRKSKDVLEKILLELSHYAAEHFTREEKLFMNTDYPNKEEHLKQHKDFTNKVYNLYLDYKMGRIALSIDIAIFVKDWLVNHIMKTDKEYVDYI